MRLEEIIRDWQRSRNAADDDDVSAVDAKYALRAGLPVLAALHELAARLEQANPYVSAREVLAELRPVISLAVGEGERRADRAGVRVEIPGTPSVPTGRLLEDLLC